MGVLIRSNFPFDTSCHFRVFPCFLNELQKLPPARYNSSIYVCTSSLKFINAYKLKGPHGNDVNNYVRNL